MKVLTLVVLLASVVQAETSYYVGKDAKGDIVRKDLVINSTPESLDKLEAEFPDLNWTAGRREDVVKQPPSLKDRYQAAKTVDEKLVLIEEALNLK